MKRLPDLRNRNKLVCLW